MEDDEIWKQINAGGGGGMDVEDELAALEAELGGGAKKGKKKKKDGDDLSLSDLSDEEEEEKEKPNQKQKHDSDDDLAALEKEGLDDDLDDEDEENPKKKPQEKNQPKPQPKPQPQQKPPQPQINKQELPKAINTKQENKSNSGIDLYPEKVEKKYHSVEKMVSLGVLEKEKEICDKIIQNKKNINEDYDTWELKKNQLMIKLE